MNEPIVTAEVCDPVDGQRATDLAACGRPAGQPFPALPANGPVVLAQVIRSRPPANASAILDNGWAIVGLLFVAGPLGLPALWFSRRFSWKVKLAGTIGLLLLTFVLPAALIWYLYATAIGPVLDVLAG